jgi:hypothetical protein
LLGPPTFTFGVAPTTRATAVAERRKRSSRCLVESVRPVAYTDLGALDPGFDESRFFTVVADLTLCARSRRRGRGLSSAVVG